MLMYSAAQDITTETVHFYIGEQIDVFKVEHSNVSLCDRAKINDSQFIPGLIGLKIETLFSKIKSKRCVKCKFCMEILKEYS